MLRNVWFGIRIFPFQIEEENRNYATLISELENIKYKGKTLALVKTQHILILSSVMTNFCSRACSKQYFPWFSRANSTDGASATEFSNPTWGRPWKVLSVRGLPHHSRLLWGCHLDNLWEANWTQSFSGEPQRGSAYRSAYSHFAPSAACSIPQFKTIY